MTSYVPCQSTDRAMSEAATVARSEIKKFLREQHDEKQIVLLRRFDQIPFYIRWTLFTVTLGSPPSLRDESIVIPAKKIKHFFFADLLKSARDMRDNIDDAIRLLSELTDHHHHI